MATLKSIQVVRMLGPRIDLGGAVGLEQIARDIAADSGFDVADVVSLLHKAAERRNFYLRLGHPVHMDQLGNYTPKIDGKGNIGASLTLPRSLRRELTQGFMGEIINKENIGKSRDELVAQYLADHPGDTVE